MVHCSYDMVTGMGTFAFHTICEKAISYIYYQNVDNDKHTVRLQYMEACRGS